MVIWYNRGMNNERDKQTTTMYSFHHKYIHTLAFRGLNTKVK